LIIDIILEVNEGVIGGPNEHLVDIDCEVFVIIVHSDLIGLLNVKLEGNRATVYALDLPCELVGLAGPCDAQLYKLLLFNCQVGLGWDRDVHVKVDTDD
jgi:hypothetical protein